MLEIGSQSFAPAGQTTLHWVESGQGPPLVLLHGLCDAHRTWRRVAHLLAAHHRVLLVDLPGHGLSGRPDAPYDLPWHAQTVTAWADSIGLDDFDLVGHSFGGGVAQSVLLAQPDRVRRLGLVASGGFGRETPMGLRLMSALGSERLMENFLQVGTRMALWTLRAVWSEAEERRWLAWANGTPGTGLAQARTIRAVVNLGGQTSHFLDHAAALESLPPVALLWGENDQVLPIAHGRTAVETIRGATLTIFPSCGHYPHLEKPGAFAHTLSAFLDADNLSRPRLAPPLARRRPSPGRRAWTAVRRFFRRMFFRSPT